jgi:hypothetical protein
LAQKGLFSYAYSSPLLKLKAKEAKNLKGLVMKINFFHPNKQTIHYFSNQYHPLNKIKKPKSHLIL